VVKDALMTEQTEYVVDTYGMPRDEVVETNRFVLRLIAPNASSFETDIPLQGDQPPPSLLEAARRLSTHSRNAFSEPPYYGQTGEVSSLDAESWTAFVSFSPYAYDATVWSETGEVLVAMADEGTSLVVRLEPHEHDAVVDFVGQDRVIPMCEWNKIRRRVLKERRRKA
jgi:hypothetical protein